MLSQVTEMKLSGSHTVMSDCNPWTVACQVPLSMGFSRQYWSGLPFPSPGSSQPRE